MILHGCLKQTEGVITEKRLRFSYKRRTKHANTISQEFRKLHRSILETEKNKGSVDIQHLITQEARRRGLSDRTIDTYVYCVTTFLKKTKNDPRQITKQDIRAYIDTIITKGHSGNTLNVHVNALKFFFQNILRKNVVRNIVYTKTPQRLPVFLTKEEVKQLFHAISNEKHKLLLELLYGSGMRVSEITNLKKEDLNIEKGIGWVRQGKGKKDRIFIIPEQLKGKIRLHLVKERESIYVFAGRNNRQLHIRTVQEIIKHATRKANIRKCVHPHTLRHSFATHLVENGYDITQVQSLLGHNSLRTTMIYVHMADPKITSVKSPYDELT